MLQGDDLRADARDLIALQDAGVSDELIDAVVAVSNPEQFMVEVGQDVDRYDVPPYPVHYRGYMSVAQYWGPRWGSRYGYSPYYSPFYGGRLWWWVRWRLWWWVLPRLLRVRLLWLPTGHRASCPPEGNRGGGAVYRDGYRRGGDRRWGVPLGREAQSRLRPVPVRPLEEASTGSDAEAGQTTPSDQRRCHASGQRHPLLDRDESGLAEPCGRPGVRVRPRGA